MDQRAVDFLNTAATEELRETADGLISKEETITEAEKTFLMLITNEISARLDNVDDLVEKIWDYDAEYHDEFLEECRAAAGSLLLELAA